MDGSEDTNEFRTARMAAIADLNGFIAGLDPHEPTVIVAPSGARAFVLSEAAYARLMEQFEDTEDRLSIYEARAEGDPVRPFGAYMRERERRESHVPH